MSDILIDAEPMYVETIREDGTVEKDDNEVPQVEITDDLKIVEFGIDSTDTKISVQEIIDNPKKYIFNDVVQREADRWNIKQKSLLIHSILMKIPIPALFVQRLDRRYNFIDGKQRGLSSIYFVDDRYALDESTPPVRAIDAEGNEIDVIIAGKKFSELPKVFQSKILNFHFDVKVMDMDVHVKNVVFSRLNNNEPLKPVEKLKAIMDMDFLTWIASMKNKNIFRVGLSDNAIRQAGDQGLLLQSLLMMIHDGNTGLAKEDLESIAKNGVSNEVMREFEEVADYLTKVVEEIEVNETKGWKKIFQKAKTATLFVAAKKAIKNNISIDTFSEWVERFFFKEYDEHTFKDYVSAGSSRKDRVVKRTTIMMDSFYKEFNLS